MAAELAALGPEVVAGPRVRSEEAEMPAAAAAGPRAEAEKAPEVAQESPVVQEAGVAQAVAVVAARQGAVGSG